MTERSLFEGFPQAGIYETGLERSLAQLSSKFASKEDKAQEYREVVIQKLTAFRNAYQNRNASYSAEMEKLYPSEKSPDTILLGSLKSNTNKQSISDQLNIYKGEFPITAESTRWNNVYLMRNKLPLPETPLRVLLKTKDSRIWKLLFDILRTPDGNLLPAAFLDDLITTTTFDVENVDRVGNNILHDFVLDKNISDLQEVAILFVDTAHDVRLFTRLLDQPNNLGQTPRQLLENTQENIDTLKSILDTPRFYVTQTAPSSQQCPWRDNDGKLYCVGATIFSCALKCVNCAFPDCQTRVCIGRPYCPQHTSEIFGVCIKPTNLTGLPTGALGLFASRDFKKDDVICPYLAESIIQTKLDDRYDVKVDSQKLGRTTRGSTVVCENTAPYGLENRDSACIRGIGSLANDAHRQTNMKNNAELRDRYYTTQHTKSFASQKGYTAVTEIPGYANWKQILVLWLRAISDIRAGDEILVEYGPEYWKTTQKQGCPPVSIETTTLSLAGHIYPKSTCTIDK